MTNKIDKLIEALIEDIDTTKLWRLCFNKMTNSAKRQMINEMLNLIIGSAYPINGPIFSKIKDEINSSDKDVEEIDKLRIELADTKAEEKYLKQCCEKAGEELAKHSFGYDGKEKNLVVQAMELNEKYEKLIDQNASLQKQVEDMIKWQKTVAKLFDRTCRCQFLDEETAICKENGKECISIVGCRDRYRKEYEELKNELDLYKTWYRAKHGDVKNTLGRYRKALDKIEEYCDEQISLTGDLPFRTTESDILDIINKVKGDNR